MAEEYVSRDQHRADLAELRGDLKEEVAGIRQDVALLAKTIENLTQTMSDRFARSDERIAQVTGRFDQMEREVMRQFTDLRQDIRELRVTGQRQIWVLVGVVVLGFLSGVIKVIFFP